MKKLLCQKHTKESRKQAMQRVGKKLRLRCTRWRDKGTVRCSLCDDGGRSRRVVPSPVFFMNTSAAIDDPLLRRAFGRRARPSDPHRTARVRIGSSRSARRSRDAVLRFRDKLSWI